MRHLVLKALKLLAPATFPQASQRFMWLQLAAAAAVEPAVALVLAQVSGLAAPGALVVLPQSIYPMQGVPHW